MTDWTLRDLRSLETRNGVAWTATLCRDGQPVCRIDESDPGACWPPPMAWSDEEARAEFEAMAISRQPEAAPYGADVAALEECATMADGAGR